MGSDWMTIKQGQRLFLWGTAQLLLGEAEGTEERRRWIIGGLKED